jgi:hypothetical protein
MKIATPPTSTGNPGQPRDLQFRGPFLEMFFSPSLLIPYLSLTPPLVEARSTKNTMEHAMQDLLMVVFAVVFFGVALLYVRGCDKLR